MTPAEAAALLTICAAFDNRKPDADAAKAWAIALDGYRYEDCRLAVVAHFKVSRDWLMPCDVIEGVKRIRYNRVAEFGPFAPPPELDPSDTTAYFAWLNETTRRIADGELTDPTELAQPGTPRELPPLDDLMPRVDHTQHAQAARAALRGTSEGDA